MLGFFGILVRFVVVNRGEVVVICVAKVVGGRSHFRGRKIGHSFQLYFSSVFETGVAEMFPSLAVVGDVLGAWRGMRGCVGPDLGGSPGADGG